MKIEKKDSNKRVRTETTINTHTDQRESLFTNVNTHTRSDNIAAENERVMYDTGKIRYYRNKTNNEQTNKPKKPTRDTH